MRLFLNGTDCRIAYAAELMRAGWSVCWGRVDLDRVDAFFNLPGWEHDRQARICFGYFSTKHAGRPVFTTLPEARDFYRKAREAAALAQLKGPFGEDLYD